MTNPVAATAPVGRRAGHVLWVYLVSVFKQMGQI